MSPMAHDGGAIHSHHGPHDCQGGTLFLRGVEQAEQQCVRSAVPSVRPALLDDQYSLIGAGSEQHLFAAGRLLLPVRLHLANQVLLI